jgi:hypothetical protein
VCSTAGHIFCSRSPFLFVLGAVASLFKPHKIKPLKY